MLTESIKTTKNNLLEYSPNYSMTPGSLWNYYRDELNDSANKTEIILFQIQVSDHYVEFHGKGRLFWFQSLFRVSLSYSTHH